jgi:YbbR domain-containing protein
MISITAENISLIMGISSFIAAIIFFFAAKNSEKNTIKLLESINHKTNTLDQITTRMLEKAFNHASE